MEGFICMSPIPATVTRVPSAVAIFLLLRQGSYVEKYLDEGVIWSVAPESKIQKEVESVFETLNPNEIGSIPEYAKVYLPVGFSKLLRKALILSISSWL